MSTNCAKFDNPICQQCIKEQKEKYQDFVDEEGVFYEDFAVQCDGIPQDYLSDHLRAILSKEEAQEALELFDPVTWAANWLTNDDGTPWVARWYQERMLRCTAKRKISRAGRRIGKTQALAVGILHKCFTRKNRRVLVIAPYKAQTKEIINRIRVFINNNPKLASSVPRCVESPYYEIVFHNGSRIRGFSSGTKSGAEGAGIRGQDADELVIDEADYLTDADLKAIVAITNTHEHVSVWASSTPTGRRAHFWRWCVKTPSYKEFYYPSSVLPHWDKVKDQIKADYVGQHDAWCHEILAIFGEQTIGVFQNQLIDQSLHDYKYETMHYKPGWIYSIGVDWNSNFGTEIAVTGYDKRGRFQIVDALNIPKQNWTQLAGIEAIIAMNEKWQPSFIYVDDGAGSTNIELLRKYGYDMLAKQPGSAACRLKDIVKAYNFSSKIDARDPMTKQPIKKHAKPFMVENAVRFFEECKLMLSSYDIVLRNQLENYIIQHRTVSGVPVYGMIEERIGDHRLDAVMLSLVGFKLELSDFGRAYYMSDVAVTPGFAKLHDTTDENFSPEKEAQKRLERMPQERFNYNDNVPLTQQHSSLPAVVSSQSNIPVYRHGFMTDEEDKYAAKFKLRNLRKRKRMHNAKPKRTNI